MSALTLVKLYPELYLLAEEYPQRYPWIRWYKKAKGQITFLLEKEEFSNKTLTRLLEKIVEAIKVPKEAVCFGKVLKMPFPLALLEGMPTQKGFLFSYKGLPPREEGYRWETKVLYVLPSLYLMQQDVRYKKIAWNLLKRTLLNPR